MGLYDNSAEELLKVIEIILRIYWQFLQVPDSTKSALDISKLL